MINFAANVQGESEDISYVRTVQGGEKVGGSVIKRSDDKYLIRFYLGVENSKHKYYSEMVTVGQKKAEAACGIC